MQHGQAGQVYNLCSGVATRIGDIVDLVVARGRIPVAVRTDPTRLRPVDEPVLMGDNTRLQRDTGWQPQIDIPQIVDELLAYWRMRVAAGDV
jgi:GDP-4-dehydro-6-deoxy-D-mannose reductase